MNLYKSASIILVALLIITLGTALIFNVKLHEVNREKCKVASVEIELTKEIMDSNQKNEYDRYMLSTLRRNFINAVEEVNNEYRYNFANPVFLYHQILFIKNSENDFKKIEYLNYKICNKQY